MLVGLVGVFNSISYCLFPSSECTGDLRCVLVLLVSCGCNTSCVLGSYRAVPAFLLEYKSVCINQVFQAFILPVPSQTSS